MENIELRARWVWLQGSEPQRIRRAAGAVAPGSVCALVVLSGRTRLFDSSIPSTEIRHDPVATRPGRQHHRHRRLLGAGLGRAAAGGDLCLCPSAGGERAQAGARDAGAARCRRARGGDRPRPARGREAPAGPGREGSCGVADPGRRAAQLHPRRRQGRGVRQLPRRQRRPRGHARQLDNGRPASRARAARSPVNLPSSTPQSSPTMNAVFRFGDPIEGYPVPVLNERAVRAGAGILFVFAMVSFMNAWLTGNFQPTRVFVVAFLVDFTIRIFVNPRYAPSLILGQWAVRSQQPEWVGAPQKRFAWAIGFVLAADHAVPGGDPERDRAGQRAGLRRLPGAAVLRSGLRHLHRLQGLQPVQQGARRSCARAACARCRPRSGRGWQAAQVGVVTGLRRR
ncbi:MAG: DUF4395 domain-containing protein [Desulfosudis oleivorans]|nr:DUF4395 domain-containing protein [Desulfosudis oleivorans]